MILKSLCYRVHSKCTFYFLRRKYSQNSINFKLNLISYETAIVRIYLYPTSYRKNYKVLKRNCNSLASQ